MAEETKFQMYKGFPLVRNGNTIYYGNMYDETVANLNIQHTKTEIGLEVADKVQVILMRTAQDIDLQDMVVKTSTRESLYDALDIANIWLTREN